jgi:signal transduction histidine kinase
MAAVVLVTAVMVAVSVRFDLSEALRRWTAPWERFQLDELPAVLVVLAAGLAWFAARRYRDAGRELHRRKLAEAQLETALADNRRLSQQYVELQEAERKNLARELHDELGQYLNVIKLDAVGIRDGRSGQGGLPHEGAEAIVANCDHIHTALAALIRQLRPVGLDDLGLSAALEHCVDTWRARLPQTHVRLDLSGDLDELDEALTLTVYRVVQEGLNNVAKHSSARHVRLSVARAKAEFDDVDSIAITISDDGVGAITSATSTGLGLVGMRERVAALLGRLEVTTERGKGFQLSAEIPVRVSRVAGVRTS